jgi:Virulence factor
VARYRILHWKEIPSLVEAFDGDQVVRVPLSQRFQDLIDAVAIREGATESDAYLEGWGQGPELDRAGDPSAVAQAVAAEIEERFPEVAAGRLGSRPP